MAELLQEHRPLAFGKRVRITQMCPTCRALGWLPKVRWVMQWKHGKKYSGSVRVPVITPVPVIVKMTCPVCHGWRGW